MSNGDGWAFAGGARPVISISSGPDGATIQLPFGNDIVVKYFFGWELSTNQIRMVTAILNSDQAVPGRYLMPADFIDAHRHLLSDEDSIAFLQ